MWFHSKCEDFLIDTNTQEIRIIVKTERGVDYTSVEKLCFEAFKGESPFHFSNKMCSVTR